MSIFNPDDFIQESNDIITTNQINQLNSIYLKKTGFDTSTALTSFNNDITIASNLICNNVPISKDEIEKLNNIDVNVKQTLTNLQNNIGGVYTNNNSYSGSNIYLGGSSFNQIILTNNGYVKNLDSFELSQLDGITSNIQSSLNNKINKIVNPVLNNLVSMDISGNCFNNDVKITTDNNLNITSDKIIPSSTSIKNYVDNKINNLSYQSVVGEGINLYFSNTSNNLSGYEDLLYTPDSSTEDIESITLNNNRVLLHSYATSSLNRTIIPSGIYSFHFYCYVNDNVSLTRFEIELYKIDLSNNLTQIGDIIYSPDVNLTTVGNLTFNYTLQNNISCNYTDKFIIKIYGFTNVSNKTIILYFYHSGSKYNSFISTPFIYKHNDLSNLDDVNGNYHHLTLLQKQNATQFSSISNNGLLSSDDFNIFNNKENYIIPSTVNHYYRGDKTFSILNKASVLLGNVDNTSDINKPISTATQLSLNLKNDIINSSTNLYANSYNDNVGNLRTELNNLKNNNFNQILYVAYQFGSDLNNGYSYNYPKKTIQSALDSSVSNSGVNIIILPFVYPENITINKQNITLSSIIYEKGGLVNISGDVNITSASSSVRLSGLTLDNLTISGNCNVYIDNSKITNLYKNATGYLEINNSSISGILNLNANFIGNFMNNNIGAQIITTTLCPNGQFNFSNNLVCGVNNRFESGIIGLSNSVCYAYGPTFNAIYATNCILYLSNMSLLNPDNSLGKVELIGMFYSFNNTFYNKTNSIFNVPTKLLRNIHNEIITADSINLNTSLIVNNESITPTNIQQLSGLNTNLSTFITNTNNNMVTLNDFQIISNKTLNNSKLNNNLIKTSSNNNITFIDISDNIVNENSSQTLNNKTLNNPKLTNNIIKSSTDNNISFVNVSDTIVNLNSNQTLTNKTLTNPKLTNNIIISSTNNNISFVDSIDTIVNLNSNQTLTNKTLTNPKLTNNLIKSSTDNNISFIDVSDNIVNENSSQTLTNKTLSNCISNTQLSSDNSNKIATTEFVKYFSAPLKKYNFNSSQSPYTFNFGDNDYLELFISGGNVYIKTKSNYNSSVAIVVMADFVYDASNVGQFTRSFTTTLTANGGNNGQMSNGNLLITTNGRGCNINIIDDTNNKLYRLIVIARSATSVLYYVETLI